MDSSSLPSGPAEQDCLQESVSADCRRSQQRDSPPLSRDDKQPWPRASESDGPRRKRKVQSDLYLLLTNRSKISVRPADGQDSMGNPREK